MPAWKLHAVFCVTLHHFARHQSVCQVSSVDQLYLILCGPNSLHFNFLGARSLLTHSLALSLLKLSSGYLSSKEHPGICAE